MKFCAKCGASPRASSSSYCKSCKAAYERSRSAKTRVYNRLPHVRARMREYMRDYVQTREGVATHLRNKAQQRAKKSGVPFAITRNDVLLLLADDTCPVSGRRFDYVKDGSRRENAPSLDQIVSGVGYVPGNVRVVTWHVNAALSIYGTAALVALAQDIIGQLAAKTREGKVQRSSREGVGSSDPKSVGSP